MRIVPLSEGAFTIDKTKEFIPFDPDKDDLQKRTTGSLLVEIQPFLVITEKDVLLLDTGLGFEAERFNANSSADAKSRRESGFCYKGLSESFA